eukprot:scaffold338_cov155-Skeletonema_menzelii.AAC.2
MEGDRLWEGMGVDSFMCPGYGYGLLGCCHELSSPPGMVSGMRQPIIAAKIKIRIFPEVSVRF